jgi:hypothetical protein
MVPPSNGRVPSASIPVRFAGLGHDLARGVAGDVAIVRRPAASGWWGSDFRGDPRVESSRDPRPYTIGHAIRGGKRARDGRHSFQLSNRSRERMLALIPKPGRAATRVETPDPESLIGGHSRGPRLAKSRVADSLARYAGVSIAWTQAIGGPPVGSTIHMMVLK